MILADKIIELRKKLGWSQEQLAEQLGVSRQSVSKWESTLAMPDIDKIVKMSGIFGVSVDYLLKEEIEIPDGTPISDPDEHKNRKVSLEEANSFMDLQEADSTKIGLAVALCILSPALLIFLLAMSANPSSSQFYIDETVSTAIGISVLIILVAIAVYTFMSHGFRAKKFEYLEKEPVELIYGVKGIVEKRKADFDLAYRTNIAIGVILCIVSVIPLLLSGILTPDRENLQLMAVGLLLIIVAAGVFLIVRAAMIGESFDKLLEEGDYSRKKKENSNVGGIYWSLITAAYLLISFLTSAWAITWLIWPVAAVFYGAVTGTAQLIKNKK